jgi:TonB family protein
MAGARIRRGAFLVCLILLITLPAARAQSVGGPRASQPAYENSEAGLKHLMQDALAAGKADDQAKLLEIANSMALPSPQDWFVKVFGPDWGQVYAQLYAKGTDHAATELAGIFLGLAKEKYSIFEVRQFKNSCDFSADQDEYPLLAARVVSEPLSLVRFSQGGLERTLRFLAYVDGNFRFLGLMNVPPDMYPNTVKVMDLNSDAPPPKPILTVDANIQMAKILNRMAPVYPGVARENRIGGKVILHTVIKTDGTVGDIHVMRGQCPFAEAAVDAVKRWRFSPTLLAGEPVPTQTNFEVTFNIAGR